MEPDNDRLHRREKQALLALLALILLMKRRGPSRLSRSGFVVAAQDLLLQAYIAARAIGRGAPATASDIEAARTDAAAQEFYLRGFATVILGSSGITARMIRARAALYVLRMTGHANDAWSQRAIAEGDEVEALWVTMEDRGVCPDCDAQGDLGWRPLSDFTTFPGQGATQCLSRCRCYLEMRNGQRGFSNA